MIHDPLCPYTSEPSTLACFCWWIDEIRHDERERLTRESHLHTVESVAKHLNISRTRAYALIGEGQIESVTIGRARRITQSAIDRYIEKLESAAKTDLSR